MTQDPERHLVDRALSVHAAAEECPAHIALIDQDGRRWSWEELSTEVAAVKPGLDPRFEILDATSRPATIVRILASIDRALPVAPIDPRLSGPERQARIDLLDADQAAGAADAGGAIPTSGDRRPLAVLFTSGSTGAPRAVELSRAAFVASASASAERLGWREDDRWLCVLPLAHVGGLSILIRCLIARRTVVLVERFDAKLVCEVIERERATLASFVPTMLSRLLARDPTWRAPPSLRAVLLGGAPASEVLWSDVLDRRLPALETWGMTETCSQVATAIPGESPRSPVPLHGWNVRSRSGRLEVMGPALLTRYIEHGPGSSPFSAGGWFSTGDLGTVNPDGSVSISGRADEIIVTGGENVSPFEVEQVLESVAGVRKAIASGIPDAEWGEIVAVALELEEDRCLDFETGSAPTPDHQVARDLQHTVTERLATFQRPRRIIWLQRIPETSAGKVDRAEVRRRILLEAATEGKTDPSHGT